MRILVLHNAAAFGGSSKSLIELLGVLKDWGVSMTVMLPKGRAAQQYRLAGMQTLEVRGLTQWDDTLYGHYRGLRWLVLLRELFLWPFTLAALWRLRGMEPFEAVHINDLPLLPSGIAASKLLKIPLVVHVRSLQRGTSGDWRTSLVNRLLKDHADLIVAIDERVKMTLPHEVVVQVVHNSLNVPEELVTSPRAPRRFQVAIVGSIIRSKGVREYLEAARLCRDRGLKVDFLVLGENVRNARGFKGWMLERMHTASDLAKELNDFSHTHNLQDHVRFMGFVADVRSVYADLDVLCFPSYLDAPGRPVFEAAFFGVPSIVATRIPTTDTIVPGMTGICISEPDSIQLADAIEFFYRHPEELKRMGDNAKKLAKANFDPELNARRMLQLYTQVISRSKGVNV